MVFVKAEFCPFTPNMMDLGSEGPMQLAFTSERYSHDHKQSETARRRFGPWGPRNIKKITEMLVLR